MTTCLKAGEHFEVPGAFGYTGQPQEYLCTQGPSSAKVRGFHVQLRCSGPTYRVYLNLNNLPFRVP